MLTPISLVSRLVSSGIAKPNEIIGCSDQDILLIQNKSGLQLPQAYIDFLIAIGRNAGSFMSDIDFLFPKVLGLNEAAADILNDWEEGKLVLPEKAFVFSMRYGEQFMFFIADEDSDDPPVYFYFEKDGKFKKTGESIWRVIDSSLEMEERIHRENPDSPLFN